MILSSSIDGGGLRPLSVLYTGTWALQDIVIGGFLYINIKKVGGFVVVDVVYMK